MAITCNMYFAQLSSNGGGSIHGAAEVKVSYEICLPRPIRPEELVGESGTLDPIDGAVDVFPVRRSPCESSPRRRQRAAIAIERTFNRKTSDCSTVTRVVLLSFYDRRLEFSSYVESVIVTHPKLVQPFSQSPRNNIQRVPRDVHQ